MSGANTTSHKTPQKSKRSKAKYWHIYDAVHALKGSVTLSSIKEWLQVNYPDVYHGDASQDASHLSVNSPSRHNYDKSRKSFRSDQGHPRDLLFIEKHEKTTFYTEYNAEKHGVWDLRINVTGSWEAFRVFTAAELLAQAHHSIEYDIAEAIHTDHDARVWELRAVALREGQHAFRNALLKAYNNKCAITGSSVISILEAAHIFPYRGKHTDRVDNGLLLRADIHTLFDKGLIYIDSKGGIQLDSSLSDSEYNELHGRKLRLPDNKNDQPHPDHIAKHRMYTAGQTSE